MLHLECKLKDIRTDRLIKCTETATQIKTLILEMVSMIPQTIHTYNYMKQNLAQIRMDKDKVTASLHMSLSVYHLASKAYTVIVICVSRLRSFHHPVIQWYLPGYIKCITVKLNPNISETSSPYIIMGSCSVNWQWHFFYRFGFCLLIL